MFQNLLLLPCVNFATIIPVADNCKEVDFVLLHLTAPAGHPEFFLHFLCQILCISLTIL